MRITVWILSLLLTYPVFAGKYGEKEYALGVNVNSNSYFIGGMDFAIRNIKGSRRFLIIEGVNVKHPNEVRWASGFNSSNVLGNKPFVLGKTNYLFALRGQMGYETLLFHKGERNGVEVCFNMAGGLTLGLVKPYYIKYQYTSELIEIEQYEAGIHQYNNILGGAGPFYKIERSAIVPGLNTRISLNFDYGSDSKFKTIIETGFVLEAFAKPIEIIDGAPSERFFGSAFVALYLGKN